MASQSTIITVFGSSRPRPGELDYEEARSLGGELVRRGFQVCSGGYAGVMEAVSRGAKEAGGRTIAITSTFFGNRANSWVDEEHAANTWQERLFELVRFGEGYVACKGGTGTLAELAVVWEMLNKSVIPVKPFAALGDFWQPIIERVREVELAHDSPWGEAHGRLIHSAASPQEVALYLAGKLK